jgi:hypothetical protein
MPSARRFPPPWTIEENNDACFIAKDATGQALGYFYFEDEPGRRSTDVRFKATAVIDCVSSETARSQMTHSVTLRYASPHSREKAFDADAGSATHRTGFMIYFAYFVSRIGPDHGVAPPATSFKGVSCRACVV